MTRFDDGTPPARTRTGEEVAHIDQGTFAEIYEQHFDFVWRAARRLGVSHDALDDIVQETFVVVHRRLGEPRSSSLRTWIYGVAAFTVRNHRRSLRRKSPHARGEPDPDPDELGDHDADSPERSAQKAEAARALHAVLQQLDEDQREVFVLVELEELSAPEVADALELNVNTVYSRLRLARASFEQAVARHLARDARRAP